MTFKNRNLLFVLAFYLVFVLVGSFEIYAMELTEESKGEGATSHARSNKKDIKPEDCFDITVIGGGYTGVFTCLLLSKLRKSDGRALKICLVEKDAHLMNGSSIMPARLHLGGEYPKDPITASQCLLASILFRQMLPTDEVFTDRMYTDFLIAGSSIRGEGGENNHLTKAQFEEHYRGLKLIYEGIFEELLEKLYQNKEVAARCLFGLPKDFLLDIPELRRTHLRGDESLREHFPEGVRTPERGINPVALGTILWNFLINQGVIICSDFEVEYTQCISTPGKPYVLINKLYSSDTSKREKIGTGFIVNATGFETEKTDQTINLMCESCVDTNVYVRSLGLIDVSQCQVPSNTSYFGLLGRDGGMVSFFNKDVAAIYVPDISSQGACVSSNSKTLFSDVACPVDGKLYEIPEDKQEDTLDSLLADVKEKFPFLNKAEKISLLTRTTVSWNTELYKRSHIRPYWLGDSDTHWLTAKSTKATLAPLSALQVVAELVGHPALNKELTVSAEIKEFLVFINKIGQSPASQAGMEVLYINNMSLPADFSMVRDQVKGMMKLPREFCFNIPLGGHLDNDKMVDYATVRGLPAAIIKGGFKSTNMDLPLLSFSQHSVLPGGVLYVDNSTIHATAEETVLPDDKLKAFVAPKVLPKQKVIFEESILTKGHRVLSNMMQNVIERKGLWLSFIAMGMLTGEYADGPEWFGGGFYAGLFGGSIASVFYTSYFK